MATLFWNIAGYHLIAFVIGMGIRHWIRRSIKRSTYTLDVDEMIRHQRSLPDKPTTRYYR